MPERERLIAYIVCQGDSEKAEAMFETLRWELVMERYALCAAYQWEAQKG